MFGLSNALQQRVSRIQEVLNHYYPNPPIPLNHTNGFTFLVAVVLSAQTTDGKVNEVTKELFKLADTPEAMALLDVSLIQKIIQPVGLAPRKAISVSGLSKMILEKFGGKVPNTFQELESLPGVGHKTASVIMSQLFGVNAFAVDTHVHRLALRWGLSKDEKNVDKVQADLCSVFPREAWDKGSECPICCWINQPSKYSAPFLSTQTTLPTNTTTSTNINTSSEESSDLMKTSTMTSTNTTSSYYTQFSPKKKAKGLVYYHDRIEELQQSPGLAIYSQSSITSPSKLPPEDLVATKQESLNCDLFAEEVGGEAEEEGMVVVNQENVKTVRKPQSKKDTVSKKIKEEIDVQEVVEVKEQTTKTAATAAKRITGKKRKFIVEEEVEEVYVKEKEKEKENSRNNKKQKKSLSMSSNDTATAAASDNKDCSQNTKDAGGKRGRNKKENVTAVITVAVTSATISSTNTSTVALRRSSRNSGTST